MSTLLISLLAFLPPSQTDGPNHQLSAFPVQEETPAISVIEALPSGNQLLALDRPEVEIITPAVLFSAPKTRITPASAPQKQPELTKTPNLYPAPSSQSPSKTREIILPTPLFTGSWKQWKRSNDFVELFFTITTEKGDQVCGSAIHLTKAELLRLKDKSEVTIKRATGSMILSGGKRKGNFEFIPNNTFRTRLNDAGMGDAIAPEDALSQKVILSPLIKFLSMTISFAGPERQKDVLWLEYFLADIDDEYIQLLREYGYTEAALSELWRLAHNGTRRVQLSRWLSFSKDFFSHQLTIAQLVSLGHPEHNLNIRKQHSHPPYTYEEFKASERALFPQLPMNIELPLLSTPLIKMEKSKIPEDWGLGKMGAISDTLTACCKMNVKLKGSFRVHIVDEARKYVVAYGSPAALAALKSNISIEKMRFRNPKKGESIDLEISAKSLRGMYIKGLSQIYGPTISLPKAGIR